MAAEIKINEQKVETEGGGGEQKEKKKLAGVNKEVKDTGGKSKQKDKSRIAELEAQLEAKAQEAKETYDRLLRVSAEFENYKKRSARESADFKKYANESIIREVLPVIDNLERALDSTIDDRNTEHLVREGVELTLKEILRILEKFGVTPISALDKPFDPNFHEAVMREESQDHAEQTVVKELQKGYLIHDRLLRPAMVVVSS